LEALIPLTVQDDGGQIAYHRFHPLASLSLSLIVESFNVQSQLHGILSQTLKSAIKTTKTYSFMLQNKIAMLLFNT
jgi:hypothetical protein